jgi:hypothetical protein
MFTDYMYIDLGGSKSGTRDFTIGQVQIPAGVTANLSLDMKGWVWTLAGSYRFVATPEADFDVFAGARGFSLKQTLGFNFSGDVGQFVGPGRTGSIEVKAENWDAIVGAKGRLSFGAERRWFVPYYVDVGAGDSDLTWQALAGIGYAFSWGEIVAAWRYLDYELKSRSPLQQFDMNGPLIGVVFRW